MYSHAIPAVVELDDPVALRTDVVGAKAANLARANLAGLPVLPGAVVTTSWHITDRDAALRAWRVASLDGARSVVVRSSSTGEDGDASSMAGVFESVLDVTDERAYFDALDEVVESAERARRNGLVDAEMAILVQPMLHAAWGGVLFGADPVTGRRDRYVVGAVDRGPDALVSGEVDGWTGVLDRNGKVREVRSDGGDTPAPPADVLRRLAQLAAQAAATYGGPQDVEWAIDADGTLHMLQARPITTLPPTSGPVYGPGPVAESFPAALSPLEEDLWVQPLGDGVREALRLAGTAPAAHIRKRPTVVTVDGMVAADLQMLGADTAVRKGVFRRLDPRPPARRLRAAWRVGRLRAALPALAEDLVRLVDQRLGDVPDVGSLGNQELVAALRNGRKMLASLHGHEVLAGLLIPSAGSAGVTGASLALSALAQARAEGIDLADLIQHEPVVLALVPPRVGPTPLIDALADATIEGAIAPIVAPDEIDAAAVAREALRLRVRWVQELMARAAWELGRRLVDVGLLPDRCAVRLLSLDELAAAVTGGRHVPISLEGRREPTGRSLPTRFRLDAAGRAWAAPVKAKRGRNGAESGAVGAGGGLGTGTVLVAEYGDEITVGSVLVVSHLDPRLAPAIPRLAGLVAETGNPLSHLAILAREHGVPIVVGYAAATERFHTGDVVSVDGHTGTVTVVETAPGADVVELPIQQNHRHDGPAELNELDAVDLLANVPSFISGVAS